ncbi:MAG: hypothetical protein HY868_25485 [Chloroflexi bacterium]|nr:hypothetical protein [Chloroflexota bacterium]
MPDSRTGRTHTREQGRTRLAFGVIRTADVKRFAKPPRRVGYPKSRPRK